jgi:hypothetical protein
VAESRLHRLGRPVALVLAVLIGTAALALLLAACGGGSSESADPLVGYWIGSGKGAQMTMIQIHKDGDTYQVLSNPNRDAGTATKDGDDLVIDTHVVKMRFTPQPQDKMNLEFTGEMFKQPVNVTLSRVTEAEYKDGAVAYGLVVLRRGLAMWKSGGGKKYPPVSEVTPNGMLSKMISWPANLFTNGPMVPEASTGNYVYAPTQGGKSYSLKGFLADGSTLGK